MKAARNAMASAYGNSAAWDRLLVCNDLLAQVHRAASTESCRNAGRSLVAAVMAAKARHDELAPARGMR